MYRLFLVNHTQFEYCDVCRSNFSQERTPFNLPEDWETSDDMEMMTEFVFHEKLKKKKRYTLVQMYQMDDSSSEEPTSDKDDEEVILRESLTKENEEPSSKETSEINVFE